MEVTNFLKLATLCLDNLLMHGVDIEERHGSPDLNGILSTFGKEVIHPKMDPLKNDFTSENCFWLLAKRDGKYFGCVGARLEDLGGESATSFWLRTAKRHYPDAGPVTFDHVEASLTDVRGRVAYMGDLFVGAGDRGSATFLSNLLMLMHISIQVKWSVNCVYSFLRERDIEKAKQHLYNFATGIPDYQRWVDPPEGRSGREWLITLSRQEFNHLVSMFNDQPDRLQLKT